MAQVADANERRDATVADHRVESQALVRAMDWNLAYRVLRNDSQSVVSRWKRKAVFAAVVVICSR